MFLIPDFINRKRMLFQMNKFRLGSGFKTKTVLLLKKIFLNGPVTEEDLSAVRNMCNERSVSRATLYWNMKCLFVCMVYALFQECTFSSWWSSHSLIHWWTRNTAELTYVFTLIAYLLILLIGLSFFQNTDSKIVTEKLWDWRVQVF